jgi:UDP-perosamine 4-acetyltransferase
LTLPVIVLGGAGHAKVLISTLLLQRRTILGFVDPKESIPTVLGVARLGGDEHVLLQDPSRIRLVNGVGSIGSTDLRRAVYDRFREKGYLFEQVIHPSAEIASGVDGGDGLQVMARVVIQPGTRLGENVIINTGALVDHDCRIEAHVHIAPGVTLSGSVHIGSGAHVGTGATIIQGIEVGERSLVGAGAVVIRNVPAGMTVVGVPARPVKKQMQLR